MQTILYVDSRARTGGSDSSFEINLRETVHLEAHGMRIDNLRVTNCWQTTELGKHIYYKNGSAGIQYYSVPEQAYTGTSLAAALQIATGRTTTYDPNTNSITQSITTGQEWLSDAEFTTYSTGFPAGAIATDPQSLNTVLGISTSASGNIIFSFVKMAPFDYLFLRSRRLTVENSHDPSGRHDVLCQIPLVKGYGAVETGKTPDGVYMKLPTDLTLRTLDFCLTDWKGAVVSLKGRPLSFGICFDYNISFNETLIFLL